MSRFTRLGGLVLLVLLLVLLAAWLLMPWRTPAFSESAYDRIQLGMSFKEVEAVVGVPPKNYRQDPYWLFRDYSNDIIEQAGKPITWVFPVNPPNLQDHGSIAVQLNPGHQDFVFEDPTITWLEESYGIAVMLGEGAKVVGKAKLKLRQSDTEPPWLRWLKGFLP